MTSAELASLSSRLAFWEYWSFAASFAVLVGVIGEYISDFTHWFPKLRKRRRLGKYSTLLLVVGIAGELLGLFFTSNLSAQLVEAERSARVKIEAKLAWRGFTEEQCSRLVDVIAQVPRQEAIIIPDKIEPEIGSFVLSLNHALREKWDAVPDFSEMVGHHTPRVMECGGLTGVLVETGLSDVVDPATLDAADRLASVLNDEFGIEAQHISGGRSPADPDTEVLNRRITIVVCRKLF